MAKIDLKNLTPKDLEELITNKGWEKFRVQQIVRWVHKNVKDFDEMKNIPKKLREELKEIAYIGTIDLIKKHVSPTDETTKYLFKLSDGHVIEAVYMEYGYGNSVCVSTQVGCSMGCDFCASGLGGNIRNLSVSEMLDQVLKIKEDKGKKITHVVVMGTGEPLLNYKALVKFLKLLHCPWGLNISYRRITVSTCGIVPNIYKLADEGLPITLSISLHAPTDEIRNHIMPINNKYPIRDVLEAGNYYFEKTGRRLTFEYILIKGRNDTPECAIKLVQLLRKLNCHVNLIPANPVAELNIERPSRQTVLKFQKILEANRINVTVRRELGLDIDAACGQLRRRMSMQEDKSLTKRG